MGFTTLSDDIKTCSHSSKEITVMKQAEAAQFGREADELTKKAEEMRKQAEELRRAAEFERQSSELRKQAEELRQAAQNYRDHPESLEMQRPPSPPSPQCPQSQPQMARMFPVMPQQVPMMFMPMQQVSMNSLITMMPLPQQGHHNLLPNASVPTIACDAATPRSDDSQSSIKTSAKVERSKGERQSGSKTTVIWRNLPNNYTRDGLLELINSYGFQGSYDFFYSPVDFSSNALVGYAFINFVSTAEAQRFFSCFKGFNAWSLNSVKVSEVAWSQLQGLKDHLERYRNSAVMHPEVADDKRPALFQEGIRVFFPAPTKRLQPPQQKESQ